MILGFRCIFTSSNKHKTKDHESNRLLNYRKLQKVLYVLANAKININGIYTCTYKGVKTIIIK